MNDLQPYPAYQETDIPWLGQVPAHWEILPNRALFIEIKDQNHPDESMLSVTIKYGVIKQKELLEDSSKKDSSRSDKSGYKLVRPGDFAYNKMRAWQGAIGASKLQGIISPAYIVQRLRSSDIPQYFHHLFRTPMFAREAERWSYGITSDMWSLRSEHFKLIYSPRPPKDEQDAIARYLDWADGRIRRLIRVRQKQIKLLEEHKQVIIQQAVTGQIDVSTGKPYSAYKDSGVEWLGQVPAHWEVLPLKKWITINPDTLPENTDPEFSFSYLDIGSVGTGVLQKQPEQMRFKDSPSRARRKLRLGDTIISTVRTYLKAIYHIEEDVSELICSTGFAVLRPQSETFAKYVSYLVQNDSFTNRVSANSVGIAYPAISESKFGSFSISIPQKPEQIAISNYLDSYIDNISVMITAANKAINLLKEYRIRLNADIVTGKVDVRQAAA